MKFDQPTRMIRQTADLSRRSGPALTMGSESVRSTSFVMSVAAGGMAIIKKSFLFFSFLIDGQGSTKRHNESKTVFMSGQATDLQETNPVMRHESGAVLLEVVLALSLFAFAAATITGGMNSAMRATGNIKLEATAMDLTVTIMSEIEMELLNLADAGPEPFDEPFDAWEWEVVLESVDGVDPTLPLQKVFVIITNESQGYTMTRACLVNREIEQAIDPLDQEYEDDGEAFFQ